MALSMVNGIIPPSIHCDTPRTIIDWQNLRIKARSERIVLDLISFLVLAVMILSWILCIYFFFYEFF